MMTCSICGTLAVPSNSYVVEGRAVMHRTCVADEAAWLAALADNDGIPVDQPYLPGSLR